MSSCSSSRKRGEMPASMGYGYNASFRYLSITVKAQNEPTRKVRQTQFSLRWTQQPLKRHFDQAGALRGKTGIDLPRQLFHRTRPCSFHTEALCEGDPVDVGSTNVQQI